MECNPFHEGHQYIIGKARETAGEGGHVVVVMSGAFAQRGIPAAESSRVRTEQVLHAGADLVLELPVRYAAAGAGYFAEGAVAMLFRTGIVTDLVFGSECGEIAALRRCAEFLEEEPEDYRALLRENLSQGRSWPAARAGAAAACRDAVTLPDTPNDLLSVEYLRVLLRLSSGDAFSGIVPHAIPRIHTASASSLREEMALRGEGVHPDDFSGMLLEKLLLIDQGAARCAFGDYAGVSRDLANRIRRLLPQFVSWTQFCGLLKTRSLTRTAVSRALTHILLDVTADMLPAYPLREDAGSSFSGADSRHPESGADARSSASGPNTSLPESAADISAGRPSFPERAEMLIPYARVLGCRRASLPLLGRIRENGLSLITSRADADRFLPEGSRGRRLLDCDLRASELWDLAARMKSASRAAYNKTAQTPEPEPCAVSEFSKPLLIL